VLKKSARWDRAVRGAGGQVAEHGRGGCVAGERVGDLGCGRPRGGQLGDGEGDGAAVVQVEDAAAVSAQCQLLAHGVDRGDLAG